MRSAEFLNWRYGDPRAGRYAIRLAEEEKRLVGYSVLKMEQGRAHVVDLLAEAERADVARSLLEDAAAVARETGCSAVECWMMRRHAYGGALRRAGYVRLRGRSAELARRLQILRGPLPPEELAFLAEPDARIHIVEGDSDRI